MRQAVITAVCLKLACLEVFGRHDACQDVKCTVNLENPVEASYYLDLLMNLCVVQQRVRMHGQTKDVAHALQANSTLKFADLLSYRHLVCTRGVVGKDAHTRMLCKPKSPFGSKFVRQEHLYTVLTGS